MSLSENKQRLSSELKERFDSLDTEISLADSILIKRSGLITKIPMQRCAEEVFVLQTFKHLGIPTVEILGTDEMETSIGRVSCYTMKAIDETFDLIKHGNMFLNGNYYSFLKNIFDNLATVHLKGFGAIKLADSGVQTEYESEKMFLMSILNRTAQRKYWPTSEIDELKSQLEELKDKEEGVLVHTDILHNILVNKDGTRFYLIDPQTIVSVANKYWDLTYYLIYANGYGCTSGLAEFLKQFKIDDWNLLLITAKINAYERVSFYTKYDPSKLPGMISFLEGLKQNHIRVENKVLTKTDL